MILTIQRIIQLSSLQGTKLNDTITRLAEKGV